VLLYTEDEWVLLVKTLGSIKGIQHFELWCRAGSRDFYPFQAVADAVKNAQSLCKLEIVLQDGTFPRDPSGLTVLANALREHTALQEFGWVDICSRIEVAQSAALDPVLLKPMCPHFWKAEIMTECASADALKKLLHLQSATELHLVLETDHWLAMADEIRRGHCNVQTLTLGMVQVTRSEATEASKALASAIRLDRNLKHVYLQMEKGLWQRP
jgi:hypothetical protein